MVTKGLVQGHEPFVQGNGVCQLAWQWVKYRPVMKASRYMVTAFITKLYKIITLPSLVFVMLV